MQGKIETYYDLYDFLLELSDNQLNKPITIWCGYFDPDERNSNTKKGNVEFKLANNHTVLEDGYPYFNLT